MESGQPRIQLTKAVHGFMYDFSWLANDNASQPTQIAKLVPSNLALLGTCDDVGPGIGGGGALSCLSSKQ